MEQLLVYKKALFAFVWSVASALYLVIDGGITAKELIAVVISVTGTTAGVGILRNKVKYARDETGKFTSPPE